MGGYNYLVMEMKEFLPYIKDYLPHLVTLSDNADFKQFLNNNTNIAFSLADMLVMTLPTPKDDFYKHTDINIIK